MVNRIARIVLGVMLAGVSTVAGDVVETTDGRRLEGGVRFADGAVYVTTEQGPARLRIDEIAVLRRHHADADQPAGVATGVIPPDGLMAEYFADEQMRTLRSVGVMPARESDTNFNWGNTPPDAYNEQTFTARLTGWITAPQSGTYQFQHQGFDEVEIADKSLDEGEVSGEVHLQAGDRIAVRLIKHHREAGKHASARLRWSIDGRSRHSIPPRWFSPPQDLAERLLSFHQEHLRDDPGGLKGEYFLTPDMHDRDRKLVRVDPVVSLNWPRSTAIHPEFEEGFAARWSGKLKARQTGNAVFRVSPRVRLWIDGKKLIDAWPDGEHADKARQANFEMEEAKLYDVRVEFVSPVHRGDLVRFHWSQEGGNRAVSSQYLYPPGGVPRVRIVLPLEMAQINAAKGATILLATHAGKGTIRKAEILDHSSGNVLGESTQPPFAVTIHPDRGGITTLQARVTDSTGQIALSDPISVAIMHAASKTLPAPWSVSHIGSSRIPEATMEDNRMTVIGHRGQLSEKSAAPLVTRPLEPNHQLTARLVELEGEKPETPPMAGLIVARSLHDQDPYIALVATKQAGWYCATSERAGETRFSPVELPPLPVWLRMSRSGKSVTAEYSVDGEQWQTAGTVELGDEEHLLAGMTALALNESALVTAVFDNIRLRTGDRQYLATQPGLQLTSGSIIYGTVTTSGSSFTVRTRDGRQQTFAAEQVARVLYGPLTSDAARGLPPGWRGAVVNGDHLEGEVTGISDEGATVRSIIFGIQRLTLRNNLNALFINDIKANPKAAVIHHTGGRILATEARLDNDKLIATDPAIGQLTLTIDQVTSIDRP